jgi:hypothetical protein
MGVLTMYIVLDIPDERIVKDTHLWNETARKNAQARIDERKRWKQMDLDNPDPDEKVKTKEDS